VTSFTASDLAELDERIYSRADRVVPMRDVFKGDRGPNVIGLRHDVDDNKGSFGTALKMAEWEFEHGYSSTYFLLHGSHYWGEAMLCQVPLFEELGHEVGIHVNALAEALRQARDPHYILGEALSELRSTGVRVVGSAAHGDDLCYALNENGEKVLRFVNDEIFSECPRPTVGRPGRTLRDERVSVRIQPMSRRAHHLEYDAAWLPRHMYLSDSGGHWSSDFSQVADRLGDGQLHMLVHPDWWGEAFVSQEVVV